MMMSIDQLRIEARALNPEERARLALELLESLEGESSPRDIEAAWNAEARERLAEYDTGRTTTLSAEELHASLGQPKR